MARIKQKPIVALDWNSSARSNSNPTPPSALPAPGSNVLLQQPAQPSQTANSISLPDAPSVRQVLQDSPQQPESFPAVLQSSDSRLAPTEKILRCDICNETFPGSHLQPFRDHIEKCHADTTAGLDNDSDEGSPTDRLTTPPESERSETDRIPLPPAYSSTEVQLYPKIHDEDDETEETQQPQQRFRLPALTSISEYQDSLDAGEDGSLEDHARVLVNAHDALVQIQDEYLSLDRAAKTSQYPPTLSLEDEFDMIGGRVRGVLRETIKPSMKVVNPRAKPVRNDDPEKWYPTNQFQLDQDRTEGAVYGYITKEGARDIGHQDPIGQRARGPGENRDLRARQPMRNAVRDDDSGDESGLNAVDAALLEGGRGKREKRPSNRVIGTNSRASSVDARAKPARKNAKSRLADLGADHPSAAETLDSTNRWVDDVDADDGSGASDDESGVTKPHKGPQQSYLDPKTKKNATGKKSKNVSNNGELDDEEAAAAKAARSQKRSEGAKMGWAKRKEALAAKESTQASVNGDLDEGSQSELAKPEPNDASDAGSNLKVAPKKKVKQMIQLADGTWIEKPSAATINMRRRWQKKREAEAKGLPPPKIGRYKKTDVVLAESSSTPADFNDQENDQLLAAVDGANKRKQSELNDEDDNDADKTTKGRKKPRKNKQELSAAMVLDDDNDTVNEDTLMDEDDESAQPTSAKKKRQAEDDFAGPPRKKISTHTQRNAESLASSDEEDEVTEEEMLLDASSSPRKRLDNGGRKKKMGKKNKKKVGDHTEEERQTRSPSGHNRTGQANQRMGMDATGTSYGEPGFMSFTNPNTAEHQAAAPGSATKKNTKGKAPRKSESKDTEADSPVASIENGEEMTSSQKTVVDLEVAEAMRKREEARKAKSEKMKAITKARWASGEMHTVMEKKKKNNALKKAALNAGGNALIAIAPAPLAIAPAKAAPTVVVGIGEKVKGQGSVSQSLAPVTPTLGSFSGKGKATFTAKPESKKEPRTKQLAKSETATSSRRSISRGLSNEMDGANSEDDHNSDEDTGKPRKLTEYEMFLQISTPGAAATSDSDGRPTRARSIAGVYEGRRSGRGGSLGGVGMERNNSDDGTGMMAARGTPASVGGARKGKGVGKLSLYDQFQLLSSPTSAGSPAPRGRRPAALRAKQTFQSFGQDDEMEDEDTVAYAGPPVHLGHSRNNSGVSISSSAKKDNGKGKKAMLPPQPKPQQTKVKKEEVELGDEEESEEDSEDDGPKKKSAYDMWQDIINNGGEVPEGEKRKRVAARKSDVGK